MPAPARPYWTQAALLLVLLGSATLPASGPQGANPRALAIKQFEDRVAKYVEVRNDAIGKLGKLSSSASPSEVTSRQQAAANLVRAARANARPGDVFVPEVVPLIKEAISKDLVNRSANDRKAAFAEVPDDLTIQVNDVYPSSLPLATVPPRLLQQLPRLPEGLEYRFVARRLILLDSIPNLVVDLIDNAVPRQIR